VKLGTVTNFDEDATVRFERDLPASAARVWKTLTDPTDLAGWLAPGSIDPVVGAEVQLDFGPDQLVVGVVTDCEIGTVLEYTWSFTGEPDSLLRYELSSDAATSTLTLVHSTLPPEQAVGYGAGWHAHLDMLEAHLSGNDPIDWEERFSQLFPLYAGA